MSNPSNGGETKYNNSQQGIRCVPCIGYPMHQDDLPQKKDLSPGKKSRTVRSSCPHWDAENRLCLLVQDGLFLPVNTHIATFCLDSQHTLCAHFERLAEQELQNGDNTQAPANRRRSVRIPYHLPFRFSEIPGSDQPPLIREDDAWTVDLSDHGIRFATRQLLTVDTTIHFILGMDDTSTKFEGTGRVIWSVPLANMPIFHAGIVLTDRKMSSQFLSQPSRAALPNRGK
jgi:hypothetical protein